MKLPEPVVQVALNVLGGVLTVLAVDGYRQLRSRVRARRFRAVFGDDAFVTGSLNLVYAPFTLRQEAVECLRGVSGLAEHPYTKPGMPHVRLSTALPVSSAELRCANYLAAALGTAGAPAPGMLPDYDVLSRLDMSCVAIGGPFSNWKSRDVLSNEANDLVTVQPSQDGARFATPTGVPLALEAAGADLGLVLKINPQQFPRRTWIVCAGIGEYGTSGAAWYLANKWDEIRARARSGPFATIVTVRPGQDESATPIIEVTRADELKPHLLEGEAAAVAQEVGSWPVVTSSQSFPCLSAPTSGTVRLPTTPPEGPDGPTQTPGPAPRQRQ